MTEEVTERPMSLLTLIDGKGQDPDTSDLDNLTAIPPAPRRLSNSLTAEEAMKRWCPYSRIREYVSGTASEVPVNRSLDDEDGSARGCQCFGPGCMAWRWDIGDLVDDDDRRKSPRGYCGLAGSLY